MCADESPLEKPAHAMQRGGRKRGAQRTKKRNRKLRIPKRIQPAQWGKPCSAKHAEEAMVLIEATGIQAFSPWVTNLKGGALIAQGHYEEGIAEMRRGFAAFHASGAAPPAWMMSLLASGLRKVGRPQEGLEALEEGIVSVAKTWERSSSPFLHHVKGELLLAQNPSDVTEAERCFHTAIEIARRQGARMAELRETRSLARLLAKQGRRDEARAMLAEIYGWFTEGFDTADLKDAKALLDELSV
jgi:predicted ATPase